MNTHIFVLLLALNSSLLFGTCEESYQKEIEVLKSRWSFFKLPADPKTPKGLAIDISYTSALVAIPGPLVGLTTGDLISRGAIRNKLDSFEKALSIIKAANAKIESPVLFSLLEEIEETEGMTEMTKLMDTIIYLNKENLACSENNPLNFNDLKNLIINHL